MASDPAKPLDRLRDSIEYWRREVAEATDTLRLSREVLPVLEASLRKHEKRTTQKATPTEEDVKTVEQEKPNPAVYLPWKERPIILSGWEVRASLAGRKTQFRRPVTVPWGRDGRKRVAPDEPYYVEEDGRLLAMDDGGEYHDFASVAPSPFGDAGDRLWGRETFARGVPGCEGGISYRADHRDPRGDGPAHPMTWETPVRMRREHSRLLFVVEDRWVERLQAITEEGARAEGVDFVGDGCARFGLLGIPESWGDSARQAFAVGWDRTRGNFAANPWVWVAQVRREDV